MALWQYDMHLLPLAEVVSRFGALPERMDRSTFDEYDWWLRYQPFGELIPRLSGCLAERPSWTAEIKTWGSEDGNRVDVVLEQNRIVDIFVRVDVRDVGLDFLHGITTIAKDLGLLVLTPDMRIVEPEVTSVLTLIATSDVAEFVENPEEFLCNKRPGHAPDADPSDQ